jgi:prevent-host-death family protein
MVMTMVIDHRERAMSRMIKASEFKAKCLAIMDEVERTGQAVVITKNGKPVAELVPHRASRPKALGLLKDTLFITGDIISPIDVEWDALK